jgi:hypothetical protein
LQNSCFLLAFDSRSHNWSFEPDVGSSKLIKKD